MTRPARAQRKQFSSCDTCRKSRVRCVPQDVSRSSARGDCVHCAKRGIRCTYDWLRSAKLAGQIKRKSQSVTVETSSKRGEQQQNIDTFEEVRVAASPERTSGSATNDQDLHITLWSIFSSVLEPVFSIWLSPDCCPYGQKNEAPVPPISKIASYLDLESCECPSQHLRNCVSIDPLIQHALDCAVACFSVRWLFLVSVADELEGAARRLWLDARTALLRVIDRPSYRSILALCLFGMTPLPPGMNNEDSDSHLGEVLVQIALRQFHVVRAKRRTRHFSGSKIMDSNASCQPKFSETFSYFEGLMHWAGVMIDTSTSMTLGRPSTLCAGILGFASEPVFQLLRARNNLFMDDQPQTGNHFVAEEEALRIVCFAAAHETYCSKAISVLREAIVYGHQENEVAAAQQATLNSLACYQNTYSPLLSKCERDLLFLGQQARLSWYLVKIRYHMGILILCEVLTSARRMALIPDLPELQAESVREVLNTVEFARNSAVSFKEFSPNAASSLAPKSLCLLSIDPYPHHVVVALQFVVDYLILCTQDGSMSWEKMKELATRVSDVLELLPQCSHSLQKAKEEIRSKLRLSAGDQHPASGARIREQ